MATVKGGKAFKDKIEEIRRKLSKAHTLKVGFLEDATYPNGKSVPMIAAINEFGAPSRGQPPRPFFRRMIAEKQHEWPVAFNNLLKANDYDVERTLNLVGEGIAGQLRQSIKDLVDPPLAPSTIKRKGFDKPLIETGHMWNSVAHEVEGN